MKSRTAKSRAGVHHPGLTSSSQRDPRRSPSIIYVSDSPSDSHELASNNQNTPTDTSRYNIVYISDSDEEPESGTVVESSGLAEDAKQPNANERVLLLEQEAGVRSSKHEAQDDGITSDSEFEGAEFNANKIPKPEGEAGRPRRGGYNLEKVLGWSPKRFNRVKAFVKQRVLCELEDCRLPFTQQPPEKLRVVRRACLEKFPSLSRFEELWPITDMIKACLKYQKQSIQRKETAALAAKYRAEGESGSEPEAAI
ncbi:hypothetical protein AAF712_007389 [Marasmius tenuissimus]|uniref:Uncharacterized protein n=1 Tax=Marasmius tenuissimus TaxID=585030 RepID=A0ABR2ZWZ6_9AGAR